MGYNEPSVKQEGAKLREIRQMEDMRAKFPKIIGSTILILALGSLCIMCVRAQQTASNSSSSAVTTNWVGYLVAGRSDLSDRITPDPSPTVSHHVEIGLRSDGVVMWREATNTK
jgi:hypothetical protein